MFRSIRWRLVASYVLLTLLTVSLVGVLALSLIKRYVEQQEQEYLTANADAVARQALPLMQPVMRRADLHELARTASFLGNVQVKILDDRRRVVADSGQPTGVNEFVWIVTPVEVNVQLPDGFPHASIMVLPGNDLPAVPIPGAEPFTIFEQLPPETEYIVVHRTERPWGSRFVFGVRHRLEVTPDRPTADAPALRHILGDQATPRSQRVITVPIGELDRPIGYVELGNSPDFAAEALATARRAFLLAAGGATLLAVVVGLLVSRGLTAPLRSLTSAAGQMSSGDWPGSSTRWPSSWRPALPNWPLKGTACAALSPMRHTNSARRSQRSRISTSSCREQRRMTRPPGPSSWPKARSNWTGWNGSRTTCSTYRDSTPA
jgi:hypothetical protein